MATINGNSGNDSLNGTRYADSISGFDGNDTLSGGASNDTLSGGAGDDLLLGGDGNDRLLGGDGNDTFEGGAGRDTVYGGAGNDVWLAGDSQSGSDEVYLEDGDDYAEVGYFTSGLPDILDGGTGNDTLSLAQVPGNQGIVLNDDGTSSTTEFNSVVRNFENVIGNAGTNALTGNSGANMLDGADGNDTLSGMAGDDTLIGGAGDDSLLGGIGADSLDGGIGNDTAAGGDGNDTISGGAGADYLQGDAGEDSLDGGDGNDTLYGGTGNDTLSGGAGVDYLYGNDGNDLISGGDGGDYIDGGDGDDTIYGDAGFDTILGGNGNDVIHSGADGASIAGGQGNDTIFVGAGSTTILGGEDADGLDRDVLILNDTPSSIAYDANDPEAGTITWADGTTTSFSNIEKIRLVPCFTPGTLICTHEGPVAVEDLTPGDRVLTRDNGFQPIRWIGRRRLGPADLALAPRLQPIRIARGALGQGLPEADILVSPQHRMLIAGGRAELLFGESEVLVAADHLAGLPGVTRLVRREVTYLHLMFDAHEIIRANGAWSESYQPGPQVLRALPDPQREELFAVFPELRAAPTGASWAAARLSLKAHEARVLLAA